MNRVALAEEGRDRAVRELPELIPDRRTGKDRRLEEQDREPERRTGDERRQQLDRRGFHSSFKFVIPDAVEGLREWLKANCEGEFTIKIPNMEVTAQRGQFRVQFERESDVVKLGKMLGVTARKTITFLMVSIILVFLMSFLALAGSGFLAMTLG